MIDFQNMKRNNISYICKFPPTQNINLFKLGFFNRGFELIKRKLWLIGTLLLVSIPVYFYITYRLTLVSWDKGGEVELQFVDILYPLIAFVGIVTVLVLFGKSFGRSAPSGRTRITRSKSDSVDGFGGARALDFSHSQSGYGSKGGLPVSLSKERQRTATFREGAKDRIEDEEGRDNHD